MGFLITLFGRKEKSSSSVAKERLLEVLVHDRFKLPPATMEKIRSEIIGVLSKYIDVDREGMEVSITRGDGAAHFTANIPLKRGEALDLSQPDEPPTPLSGTRTPPETPRDQQPPTRPSPPPHNFGPESRRR